MTNKILGGIAAIVIVAAIALNVTFSAGNNMSDVFLANVEALAGSESGCACGGPRQWLWGDCCKAKNGTDCYDDCGCKCN